jgi:hypothetical protein
MIQQGTPWLFSLYLILVVITLIWQRRMLAKSRESPS